MTSFQSVIQDYFISYAHLQVSASTNTIQEKSNKEETAEVQYLANDLRLLAWRGHLSPAAPVVQSAQPIWPTETRMQMGNTLTHGKDSPVPAYTINSERQCVLMYE
jgi:hypothetical protein